MTDHGIQELDEVAVRHGGDVEGGVDETEARPEVGVSVAAHAPPDPFVAGLLAPSGTWAQLGLVQRDTLQRCTAFAHAFSADDVQGVGGAGLPVLTNLVMQGLLVPLPRPGRPMGRFRLSRSVGGAIASTLDRTCRIQIEQAHSDWATQRAEPSDLARLDAGRGRVRVQLESRRADLALAARRDLERGDLTRAARSARAWTAIAEATDLADASALLRDVLARLVDPAVRAQARAFIPPNDLYYQLPPNLWSVRAELQAVRGTGELAALVGLHHAAILERTGDPTGSQRAALRAAAAAVAVGAVALQGYAVAFAAHIARSVGHYSEAERLFRRALAPLTSSNDARNVALAHNGHGTLLWRRGCIDEAEVAMHAAVAHAERAGAERVANLARANLALTARFTGDPHRSREILGTVLQSARATGDGQVEGHAMVNIGICCRDLGDRVGALRWFEDALTGMERDQRHRGAVLVRLHIGLTLLDTARPDRALPWMDAVIEAEHPTADRRLLGTCRVVRAAAAALSGGDPAVSDADFTEGFALLEGLDDEERVLAWVLRARAALARGEQATAQRAVDRARAAADEVPTGNAIRRRLHAVATAIAVSATAGASRSDGLSRLSRVISVA